LNAIGFDIGGTSVKAALVVGGNLAATARSPRYQQPSAQRLAASLHHCVHALAAPPDGIDTVGLCLPGVMTPDGSRIQHSVNIPALEGLPLDELVRPVVPAAPLVFGDAHAAAVGYWREHPGPGRLLALAIGTGVGACVLDAGTLLRVTGQSSGHIGQIDVGPCDENESSPPIGPDGGRYSLESYLGVPALRARYGPDMAHRVPALTIADPPRRALVRAVRIAHAVYTPRRVVLLGGVGIRLAPHAPAIKAAVDDHLTSVADRDWQLECGHSDFHAAIGAAWLAAESP
jgi:predicted NBD/HSP70 family sugar kinase